MKNNYLLTNVLVFNIIKKLLKGVLSFANMPSEIINNKREDGYVKTEKKSLFREGSFLAQSSFTIKSLFVVAMILWTIGSYAQNYKPFSIRKNIETRGKMIVAGNTILGKDNLPFNDNTKSNEDISMKYIDIDGDPTTFSSSSADLAIPNQADGSPTTCYRVQYAALYWGAVLKSTDGSRANIAKIKLKLPGATTYNTITGQLIYDAITAPIPAPVKSGPIENPNTPYACYAEVTNLLNGLSSLSGTYTVADVIASQGSNQSTGISAGWTLFVIYEDPTLHMKSFTVFDGFSYIDDSHFTLIPVSGFKTPPSGPVDLQFAYATLDGDKPKGGTKLEIGSKEVTTPLRPANNFFISTIENTNGVQTPRNPSGSNTLGYDTGALEIKGADPEYIKNNQSSTSFTLQVAKGQSDPIFAFFSAYAVDIIAPKIDLTKLVKNTSGVNVGGANVNLGQFLTYEISYQNVGNDNVTNFTIKDVLPQNVIFNATTGIDYSNSGGATLQSYDSATKTLIFKIPDTSVLINGGVYTIRLSVQVVPDCNSLVTACSNEIKNQAFATYQGVINPTVVQEEGSFASTACKLGSPESTNFLVDITNCKFTQNVILCGTSVVLKASDGYTTYSWSKNPDGSNPIGTGQTFTATQTGVYYVHNTAAATCKSIVETITVSNFGVTNTNPVIPYAQAPYIGEVVICPNNGKPLPYLFLCGANDTRLIKTGITDALSINWYKLDESICPSTAVDNCANENFANSCWKLVGTGADYLANISGQFKLVLNYTGGCQSIFYFNVYQNLLNPTFTKKDIICSAPGQISIGNVPTGYEYSIDGVNYIPNSPVFTITTPGNYTVFIKQIGVTSNPCIFSVPNIQIFKKDLIVQTFLTQPSCHGVADGSIKLIAGNVEPQYYFSIYKGATLVNSVGPILANEYTFSNLGWGDYTVNVSTSPANCSYTAIEKIIDPALLKVTATLSKALTCSAGEITISVEGGTPNYNYYVNGVAITLNTPSTSIKYPVSTAGTYDIKVVDLNKCEAITSIAVAEIPKPVYTVSSTNISCYGVNSGEIKFNVTNANGYTLMYSIDNGVTYQANATFSNLAAANYNAILKYSLGGFDCFFPAQTITITGPASAVTASGGVAELAGCGPTGTEGKLRITNAQGGTAPYQYSFDGGLTWQASNEKYVAPGTYTLMVKDALGCTFPMPGNVLDPKPSDPTISVNSPAFNCNGTATSTVTVTNNGGANFSYEYLLDGVVNTNTPPNVFVNVPSGSHTVSVTYKLLSVPTYSNLLKEDFGSGAPTTTSGIASAYCFNDQRVNPPYLCKYPNGTPSRSVEDNAYSVASFFWRSDDPLSNNSGAWYHFKDHTTNGADADGRFLLVNIGSAAGPYGVLYSKPIVDVIPNQPIKVEVYLANLLKLGINGASPDFIIELVDPSGTVVASQFTGVIAGPINDPDRNKWVFKALSLNPGNNTNLTFRIKSGSILYNGNDALIDDIKVYQLPKSCITQKDFPLIIDANKAFTAAVIGHKDITCAGNNDGEITIAVQNFAPTGFYYSLDGAAFVLSATSPLTIGGLSAGSHSIRVQYDMSASPCLFTLPQAITAPTPLTVTASITVQPSCSNGATINAVGSGGTPAYQYELRNTTGGAVVRPYQTNGQFTNVSSGNYTVFARDANLCVTNVGAPVIVSPIIAPVATLASSSDLCYDSVNQSTLVVDVTGGTGPFVYALDGGAAQNSNTFTNVGVGTHTIVVTDSKNCTSTISNIIIAPQLQLNAALTQDLTCLVDASINATVAGGNGAPYTYTVAFNGGTPTAVASFPYTTAAAGSYVFSVTDSKGCSAKSSAIVVSPKTTPTMTTSKTDISCNNANDGTITVTAANGFTSAYTYAIKLSTATLFTTQASNVFTGLTAGIYNIKVIDSKGCESAVSNVTIVNPNPIIANATATTFSCSPTNTKQSATITVTPSGGTGAYTYSYNNGISFTPSNTLTVNDNGSSQSFDIIVKDANGCLSSVQQIVLAPLNPPTDLAFLSNVISCTVTSTTVTATNGVGGLTYEIVSPIASATSNTTGVFTGLVPNTYVFKVTDANGCFYSEPYTVAPVIPIAIVGQNISNVLCNGGNTGLAKYTVSGFSSTGNYAVVVTPAVPFTNVNDVITLSNLIVGTYNVRVTDNTTGCTANTDVIITGPATPLSLSVVNVNANCNVATATVTATASGGTPGYLYSFVQDGFAAGTYSSSNTGNLDPTINLNWDVYVKDANGCTTKTDVTIAKDPIPTVTASVTNQCSASGSTFQIKAVGTNGVAPYTYTINSGVAPSPADTFTVAPGTYFITVKDANGCTNTTSVTVNQVLNATAVLTKDLDCTASPNAVITVSITGGKAPFSYQTSIGGSAYGIAVPIVGTSFTYPVTSANTYQFLITDSNVPACTKVSNLITVNPIVYPVITALTETQSIKCNGDANGRIQVTIDATKGVAPFTYSIDGTNYQSSNVFTGLTAGNYTVTVKDSKGCINTVPASITIAQPDPISFDLTKVDITCNNPGGSSLGSITVENVLGGTAPFKYFITNNFGDIIAGNPYVATVREDHTFSIINYGVYTINVIDANGCSLTKQITIASPPSDLTIDVTTITSDCTNGGTAIVKAISTLGSGSYAFGILETNTNPYTSTWFVPDAPGGDTRTFTNLVPGVTYTFVVHDLTTDCYYVKAANQPIPAASLLTAAVTPANVTCIGANDGSATFTLTGFDTTTTSVDYQIFTAYTNVAVAGTSGNISVLGVPPFTLTVPSPGTLSPGQYYIKFIENGTGAFNGCQSASAIFEIKESAIPLSVSAAVVQNENCNNLGIINALAKDGTAPYSYMITSSATAPLANDPAWNSSSTFNVAAGSYYVHVKDAYNCIQPSTVVVLTKDPEPVIALAIVDKCVDEGTFGINVSLTTSGIAPYTILVNGGASQNVAAFPYTITGLNSGLQTVRVIDANGCFSEQTITIDKKLSINVALTKEIDCTVSPNAVITLNAIDGLFTSANATPDFTYEVAINGSPYGAAVPFANDSRTATYTTSTAGTYQFRITDLNSCSVETTVVTVNPKVDPTATSTHTKPSCPTVLDGTLTITASLGIPPYEYSINAGTSWQTSNTFTGLGAGLVNYIVRDSKQCLFNGSETLIDPVLLNATAVVTDFACNASNIPQTAIVTVNATVGTGTAPYTYNFDGSANYYATNLLYVVDNGTIQTINYSAKDANGCIFNGSTTVNPYQKITDITIVGTAPTCPVPTSDVTLTVVGGYTPIAKYEIISPISVDNGTNPVFTSLAPNTYLFKVTDAHGCSFEKAYQVKPINNITVSGLITSEVTCFGLANGSAEFTVENFAGTYTAALTTGTGTLVQAGNKVTISGLAFGNYTVTVTDNVTGCSANASLTITQPSAALSSISAATNINCNNDTATVTITATGGTAPYKYAIARASDPVPTSFVLSNQLVVDTNNGADMNWVVYVIDSKGCSMNNPQNILLDTNPTITSAVATQCPSATGSYTITVTATGFSPALEYSVDGISFQTSNILTVNAPGIYNVTVKDANGCLSTTTPVTILQPLSLTAVVATTPSCANNDGIVNVSATGGSANYQFNIDGGAFVATTSFTGVTSGNHTMGVRDTTTLCEFYVPISITPATTITGFTLTSTPVTCNGGNDGTITATMATPAVGINDNPVYMYSLNGGTPQASNIFTGLTAATGYSVTVTSARGCQATALIDVIQPAVIDLGASTVVQFGCTAGTNGTNYASITANTVVGASGTYTIYEFIKNGVLVQRGASNSYIESDLLGGSFTINVFDNKGCMGSTLAPIIINPFISLDKINVAITAAINCSNNESIAVTVATTGGIPAANTLSYTVSGLNGTVYNATNTTGIFNNLIVGQYQIDVLNTVTGCSLSAIHFVNNPNTFELKAVKTNDVVCYASNEGRVELTIVDNQLTPTNDAGAFNYVITSAALATPINGTSTTAGPWAISGLTAGLYNVTATLQNSPFCSATTSFTITQAPADLVISETHTEITCVPGNNGSISVTATGGWPGGYQYELVGPVNVAYGSQTYFTNLTAGSYTVNVKDQGGCVKSVLVNLVVPTPIAVTAAASPLIISCFGDKTGTITATSVTGGQGSNYLYTLNYLSVTPAISNGPQVSNVFTGLGAGTYSVTVTDTWGCSGTTSGIITIDEPKLVQASLVKSTSQTCTVLSTLILTAKGGIAPYTYSTDNITFSSSVFYSSVTVSAPVGTNRYYVKDSNGCKSVVSNDVEVEPLPALTVQTDYFTSTINCNGETTGVIVAKATGGLGNYVYYLQDGLGYDVIGVVQATPGNFTQLKAGTYMVYVESGDCSATSIPVTITQPTTALSAISVPTNATCNGLNNGKIVVTASGGTGKIKYAISPDLNQFFDTGVFDNLVPGSYDIITQDQNGCYVYETGIIIAEPTPLSSAVITGTLIPEVCFGDKDGAFSITVSGGTAPYSVRIDGGTFTTGTLIQTDFDFTGLSGGMHTVYIRDANFCSYEFDVPLPESVKLNPQVIVDYGCSNNAPTLTVTVTIDASITNPADVDYALDGIAPYQASNVFTNVPPGVHHITARHTNGCEKDTPDFTIVQILPLTLTLTDGGLNEIVATATGGAGGYQYTLNGDSMGSQNKFIYYKSGDYTVTVTDANGCVASATRYFEFVDIKIPNVFTPNGDGDNDGWTPTNTMNYPDLIFYVFDRYGRKVGTYREGQFWDGKYNGNELPTGDYWYIIKLRNEKDAREFVGHFTLYR
ncbi:T9SS type B sorting domain-containing protein [Flavobacterium alvei]|nr:T9SS type B sorting domain-containing protein [Flavobacterium alvei]